MFNKEQIASLVRGAILGTILGALFADGGNRPLSCRASSCAHGEREHN